MKKNYFLISLLFVSTLSFGQIEIFDLCGFDTFPDEWTANNNVVTNPIFQADHYLLEAGATSDDIETDVYDLAEADDLFLNIEFATDNGSGAVNELKIEVSYDGGSNYTETILTTTITGSYSITPNLPIASKNDQMKFKFSNSGSTGMGIRLQCVTLTANISFKAISVDEPIDGIELPAGTTSTSVEFFTYNTVAGDYVNLTYTKNGEPTVFDLGTITSGYSFATEDGVGYSLTLTLYDVGAIEQDHEGVNFTVANALSIGKTEIEGFAIYPNPVRNGYFTIQSRGNSEKSVEIYDVLGKQVYSRVVQPREKVSVMNLAKGVYILRVDEDGKMATRKLMIE